MSSIIDASLGIKTSLLLGVKTITPKQIEDAAATYQISGEDFSKAWGVISEDYFSSGRTPRNRDLPKLLKKVGL